MSPVEAVEWLGKRLEGRHRDLLETLDLLVRVSEYLDDRADVIDGEGLDGEEGPLPNEAMSLGQEVDALLAKLKEGK